MLATVIQARDEIICKIGTITQPKPGVFLTSLIEMNGNNPEVTVNSMPSSPSYLHQSLDEETNKFLEQQSEANKRQLSFFLRAHERHDLIMKRNLEYSLDCLRRRQEIDKM